MNDRGATTRVDWRGVAARVRGDLDRADLNGRARRLAEFVVKATLMRGRTRVIVPSRQAVCDLLGISKSHLAGVVAELESALIVRFSESGPDGWELLVYADSGRWAVDWHYTREAMAGVLAMLDAAPGQVQGELIEAGPSLNRSLAEVSAENAGVREGRGPKSEVRSLNESGVAPGAGAPGLPPQSKMGVPILGTAPVNGEVTVHGLTASKLLNGERLTGVAEAELMRKLEGFVGAEDVRQWGGDWRKNWVRKHPAAFAQALRILSEEARNGWKAHTSRAAALKDLVRRLAR